jgi:hypothetical protein
MKEDASHIDWAATCAKCGHTRLAHNDKGDECAACRGKCHFEAEQ